MTTTAAKPAKQASTLHVPFLDLRVTDKEQRREMLAAVEAMLDHGRVLLGPEVGLFEQELAAYCGTKYAVGVGSGSIAIFFALRALGIGAGDEVVTSALSFIGTANGIALTGAKPVFADTGPDLTIDPDHAERAITSRTKAILPVHFTGKLPDMDALLAISRKHGVPLVEDSAPAIGASKGAKKAGSFGVAGCLSINPMKILNALGEAGAVLTDSDEIRDRIEALRYNGLINREYCHYVSTNGRIDTIQAAVTRGRLRRLDVIIAKRREYAAYYQRELAGLVELPNDRPGYRDVYYTFTLQTENRDRLMAYLQSRGVETKIQHPLLMPEHPAYASESRKEYPVAKRAIARLLCIPVHENLTTNQVEHVASCIRDFFAG